MMQTSLDELREKDIQSLLGTSENFRIEFKATLSFTTPAERLEAAKDISGLANSSGGRIFYGISESKLTDETGRAERLTPLTDRSLQARLENIVADTVHPRPHWRVVPVDVEGGFVLVVEVYPSLGRDLHMVSGDRFYHRGEARTIKMTEPEIREAYNRISLSSLALEQAFATKVKDQEDLVPGCCQSVMIVPWYPKRRLVDPRELRDVGKDLAEGPFKNYQGRSVDHWNAIRNISAYGNGLHSQVGDANPFHFFVTRAGVVHLADSRVFEKSPPNSFILAVGILESILATLRSARLILDRCHYWGPVHVVQVITPPDNATMLLEDNCTFHTRLPIGRYEQAVPEVNLVEIGDNVEPIARELCDQLFQALGVATCPLFEEDGSIRERVKKWGRL